jgi:hypothetical protein
MLRFDQAEGQIVVANVEPMALHDSRDTVQAAPPKKQHRKDVSIATIVVEKASRDVRAYDEDGNLLGFYPATIGSSEKPAPSGTFEVLRVAGGTSPSPRSRAAPRACRSHWHRRRRG